MNEMKITVMSLAELKPYGNNAKEHPQEQIEQIKSSIKEFGFNDPVAIWKNNEIIEGHGRVEAARQLGMQEVPVIRLDHLTEEERRAYMLAHNQLTMNTGFNLKTLEFELSQIDDIDMGDFGFDISMDQDWFESRTYEGDEHEEGNDEYNDFVDKFKLAKTTDDCYTPENIYEVVVSWVEKEYGVKRENFVRPFYPGGDYQAENYKDTDIVVDNPPFSIYSEIINFYNDKGVKFFLFAPSLTIINYTEKSTGIGLNVPVTYENGANVPTSFVTNLEADELAVRTAPDLYKEIHETNKENTKGRQLPKYEYPFNVVTAAMLGKYSKYGIDYSVRSDEAVIISKLDSQIESGKAIYGRGLLVSERAAAERAAAERAAAERAAAERAAAERWNLSDRENEIIKELSK